MALNAGCTACRERGCARRCFQHRGTNLTLGTIFSSSSPAEGGDKPLLQPGRNQLAAGYIIYGPQTALVLTVGQGTHIFWLAPGTNEFLLGKRDVQIPASTREYAINASNFRFWDDAVKAYVIECTLGTEGPRQANFNTRWLASLAAEAFRIFMRGGIYLYPGDSREDYMKGRLRLLYEANPIAMLTEQAGGACTNGMSVCSISSQPRCTSAFPCFRIEDRSRGSGRLLP